MYKLYNKKTIEGLSPLVVEKAEKDYIDTLIRGYTKQTTNLSDGLLEQGTIIAEGDKDATNRVRTTNLIKVIPNTKIVVNASVDGNISLEYYVYYYDISNNYVTNILGWKSLGTEIIIPNDNNIKFCRVIIRKNDNSTIIPTDISNFNVGNTPSPNYPSRIRNVGDNINLFDKDNVITKVAWFDINGNITDGGNSTITTTYIKIPKGNISIYCEGLQQICLYDESQNFIKRIFSNITDKFTLYEEASYIRIQFSTEKANLDSIKIEEGSTATPYTPYGCGSIDYEINTTQNIFNKDTNIELDGQYRSYATGNIATNQNYYGVKVKVEGNKEYKVFSYQDYSNLCYFDKDMTYISGERFGKGTIFSTPSNCEYITLAVAKNGINEFSITEAKIIHFPLSEGQLLHERDYLEKDGIHQKKKTYIVTGNENWQQSSSITSYLAIYLVNVIKDCVTNEYSINAKSNIAEGIEYNNRWNSANKVSCRANTLTFTLDNVTTIEEAKAYFKKQYESGTPVIVEYELAEEAITPLTAEQQNIIDNIELFEGYNQINSLDESDFEMKIIYTPQFTEDIRKAFRTGITKAYLEVIGTDVVIDYQNYLKNIEFSELRFVPDKGIFGQAVAKKIVVNFNNSDNTLNLQDKEIRLFIETEVDEEKYRIKYGDFIVQHPENENVNDNTSLTGLDYMIKTNVKYVDTIPYPCKLRQLANNICTQCGLTLSKESFKNENFEVENNQFVNGETCRQIIQGIALSAFSWARIDENNELHFDFDKDFTIKEELTSDDYYNLDFNKELYGPTNRVIIKDSQIDGENVTISDDKSIATNGVHEIVIEDNPFAYTKEKREQLIEAGKDLFGFSYLPINSSKLIGYIYLNCLDRTRIKNMQGQSFETYLFNHIINYEGTALDTIEVPAMTKTETKYTFTPDITQALKNTQVIVDKANQKITGIIEKQEGQSNQITSIEASLDGINTKIQDNQDDINERFNKIETTLEGTTQVLSNKGGNNIFYYAKEFWTDGTENGTAKLNEYTDTEVQKISVSGNGYKINKGTSEQKVNVKNDIYTISFTYKKLIDLATGYVLINNERIDLSSSKWKEEVITLNIDTNNVDFKIVSDTDNAFEIYDLMGTIGEEKQIWTQNPNETRTDTVTIGKGIEVKSSSKNTYARFDADGNRIFNSSTNQVVTALTDKGVETNEIDSELGKIGGILIQKMDGQTWISSLM